MRKKLSERLLWAYRYNVTFIVYFFVGGVSALIEWSAFALAHHAAGLNFIIAAVAGFVVATYANYRLSARYTFFSRGVGHAKEVALVYLVSALAFAVNLGVMAALLELTELPVMAAKILGTGAAFTWNYILRQFVVFDREPPTWRQFRDRLGATTRRRPEL
jgi:putative flippase GtrA